MSTRNRTLESGISASCLVSALLASVLLLIAASELDAGQAVGLLNGQAQLIQVRGRGFRRLWSPANPQLYADWKLRMMCVSLDTIVQATKDNGRLNEKIDEYLQPWAVTRRREHVRLNDIEGIFQLAPQSSCRPYTMPGEFQESVFNFQYTLTPKALVMQRWNEGVIRVI
jgi:hypothetical protein